MGTESVTASGFSPLKEKTYRGLFMSRLLGMAGAMLGSPAVPDRKSDRGMDEKRTWTLPATESGGMVNWVPSGSRSEPPGLVMVVYPADRMRSGKARGGRITVAITRTGITMKTITRPAHLPSSTASKLLRNSGFIPCSMGYHQLLSATMGYDARSLVITGRLAGILS